MKHHNIKSKELISNRINIQSSIHSNAILLMYDVSLCCWCCCCFIFIFSFPFLYQPNEHLNLLFSRCFCFFFFLNHFYFLVFLLGTLFRYYFITIIICSQKAFNCASPVNECNRHSFLFLFSLCLFLSLSQFSLVHSLTLPFLVLFCCCCWCHRHCLVL